MSFRASKEPPTSSPLRGSRPVRRGASSTNPVRPSSLPGGRGSWTTPKRVIWTGAFAAVTIVGAIYGAGLKTQQEYKAEKKQIIEATPEERIQVLEARRATLVASKRPFEKKLEELRQRIQKEENENQARANNSGNPTPSR